MRIGFDISQTGRFKTGCGYFADCMARNLVAAAPQHTFLLYPTFGSGYWDPDWARWTLDQSHLPNVVRVRGQRRLDQLEAFWTEPPPDFEARLGAPDIVHSNNFHCPTRLRHAQLIYTLHDLAFAAHPEWTTEANWQTCFTGVFDASVYAAHILAVSDFTRRQFLTMFPHFPSDRISVVREASRFVARLDASPPAGLAHLARREFWLSIGADGVRKNQQRLLEAYARLRRAGETVYPLVLYGSQARADDDLSGWIASMDLTGEVQRLGYVDDPGLQWLYENCFAFCYPSLYEGFGLPVVEAMSLGAPVLTSNVTSLPEIVGDTGILVDPFEVDDIYAGLRALANDPSRRHRLAADGMQRAHQFSWQEAASDTLDIYHQVADEFSGRVGRDNLVGAVES